MLQLLLPLVLISTSASVAQASNHQSPLSVSVRDVTSEYEVSLYVKEAMMSVNPTPSPAIPTAPRRTRVDPGVITTIPEVSGTLPQTGPGGIDLNQLLTLGGKVWDFIVNNKPTADYQTFRTSVVPGGITNWTQLKGWLRPVAKIYRVEFKNIFGGPAGSFDYRITYIAGGSYNGKGKYLGQISFVPMNIKLQTDRTLRVRAELSEPLNFGTETDPVAGAQLLVTWSSPTTTRFQMNSAEYFIYGTGELQDLTNGN